MKPYYSDELVTLYHGDCLETTKWLDADVLVTDPPYGINYVSHMSKYGPTDPIRGDADTQLRDHILEMWGSKPALVFGTWRVDRPHRIRNLIIWDKGNCPGLGDLRLPWGSSHEEIYVFGTGWTGKRRSNVYRVPSIPNSAAERPAHPTPKPVNLLEQLITYSPRDSVIADPFAGSGSTLIAARNLGRRSIGIEIDEQYCELIVKRLSQTAMIL